MDPVLIAASMSEATFAEVIKSSSRQLREILFSQMHVKYSAKKPGLHIHGKRDERIRKLHEKLKQVSGQREIDICRELVRTWLYSKRAMLKAALDFLGVPNQDGLVDAEIDFFKELSLERVRELKICRNSTS
jgi:hypothetical protein